MGAAIFTGEYDIAVIMVKAGLGIAALVILVFSTVTTTFLDAWSAGISAESLSAKLNGKKTAIAVTVIGTAAASFPDGRHHGLSVPDRLGVRADDRRADRRQLYFAPGPLCRGCRRAQPCYLARGFIAYRLLMGVDTPVATRCQTWC